ncbi:MAG: hypothetical protein QNJ23_01705 [Woeseiaceae bacterium]|nr:hypothetical protein [Woeseiaceae bacterium]
MSYQRFEPIDPRDAFTVTARPDDEATQSAAASQAALLLAIRAGVLGDVPTAEKLKEFPLPNVRPLRRDRHLKVADACAHLGASERELRQDGEPALEQEMTRLIRELYRKPGIDAAAALFEAAMFSPHPLVAVAGAAGARETTRLRPRIRETLERGFNSEDRLTSRLAVAAMSQMPPMQDLARQQVIRQPKSRKRRRKSNTAVITHGTWAADSAWYRPGGDFYEAVKARRPDLHLHDQSFTWTGAYSKRARKADARLLQQWIGDQGLGTPDFFAHSHGGTVANLATWRGVEFDRLVLLSWPVHRDWYPKFSNVRRIVDVRVHMDLVIMADRGRQRFKSRSSKVKTHRNGWFNHSATHEPDYWDEHGLWDKV